MPRGFAALSPAQRSLMSQVGNHTRWSRAASKAARKAGTAPARASLHQQWAAEADPDGTLTPDELAEAISQRQKAHMARMTLLSARSRARGAQ